MTYNKISIAGFLMLISIVPAFNQPADELGLTEAYDLLEANYPALQNEQVLAEIYQLELKALDKQRLPDLYLKADGRIQSDAASLDVGESVQLPVSLVDVPLFSAKTYAEVQYNILHARILNAQKNVKTAQLEADMQSIEVDRYNLRQRINDLFLSIESLRQQSVLLDISMKDLVVRKEAVQAGVDVGILLESELIQIRVNELNLEAKKEGLIQRIESLILKLSQLTGKELAADVALVFPNLPEPRIIPGVDRPEPLYFERQQEAVHASAELIDALRRPQLAAFAQGGVGYPNPLNLFDTNISPYGLLGMQFSWQITDWNKSKIDKQVLELKAMQWQHAAETFQFNLQTLEAGYSADIERLLDRIQRDEAITALQDEMLFQAGAQLEEGVITVSDYMLQVNEGLNARQNLVVDRTELLRTQLEFWNERGGF